MKCYFLLRFIYVVLLFAVFCATLKSKGGDIMAQSTFSVRMDSETKRQLDEFCEKVGLTSSAAINLFAKTVVREQRIPFSIEIDPFYSETNMARLEKSMKQMEATGGTVHDLSDYD